MVLGCTWFVFSSAGVGGEPRPPAGSPLGNRSRGGVGGAEGDGDLAGPPQRAVASHPCVPRPDGGAHPAGRHVGACQRAVRSCGKSQGGDMKEGGRGAAWGWMLCHFVCLWVCLWIGTGAFCSPCTHTRSCAFRTVVAMFCARVLSPPILAVHGMPVLVKRVMRDGGSGEVEKGGTRSLLASSHLTVLATHPCLDESTVTSPKLSPPPFGPLCKVLPYFRWGFLAHRLSHPVSVWPLVAIMHHLQRVVVFCNTIVWCAGGGAAREGRGGVRG